MLESKNCTLLVIFNQATEQRNTCITLVAPAAGLPAYLIICYIEGKKYALLRGREGHSRMDRMHPTPSFKQCSKHNRVKHTCFIKCMLDIHSSSLLHLAVGSAETKKVAMQSVLALSTAFESKVKSLDPRLCVFVYITLRLVRDGVREKVALI